MGWRVTPAGAPHPCPLCCPVEGHTTAEAPYWLGDAGFLPAPWRFVYHVILPIGGRDHPPQREAVDCARLFAQVYGDRVLSRAIGEARRVPLLHGQRWNPVWDAVDAELHRAVSA